MDQELYELAKDNALTYDEALEVQEIADENEIELDEAFEIWQRQ
ncbi:MAG: hypothetical protein WAN50_02880 [Minisyncoccia bacterium]